MDGGEMGRKWVPDGNLYVFAPHPPNRFHSSEVVQESESEGYENMVASARSVFPLESVVGVINQGAEGTSFAGVRWLGEIGKQWYDAPQSFLVKDTQQSSPGVLSPPADLGTVTGCIFYPN